MYLVARYQPGTYSTSTWYGKKATTHHSCEGRQGVCDFLHNPQVEFSQLEFSSIMTSGTRLSLFVIFWQFLKCMRVLVLSSLVVSSTVFSLGLITISKYSNVYFIIARVHGYLLFHSSDSDFIKGEVQSEGVWMRLLSFIYYLLFSTCLFRENWY